MLSNWLDDVFASEEIVPDEEDDPTVFWWFFATKAAYLKGLETAFRQLKKSGIRNTNLGLYASLNDFSRGVLNGVLLRETTQQTLITLSKRILRELKQILSNLKHNLLKIYEQVRATDTEEQLKAAEQAIVQEVEKSTRLATVILAGEVVRSHAEAQLDLFESVGVVEFKLMAEWVTAKDTKVCTRCASRDGQIMTIREARGLIPLHNGCRCIWVPIVL